MERYVTDPAHKGVCKGPMHRGFIDHSFKPNAELPGYGVIVGFPVSNVCFNQEQPPTTPYESSISRDL